MPPIYIGSSPVSALRVGAQSVSAVYVGSTLAYPSNAVAFSPSTLFAAGEQGVWYDPSDMSTLYQDSAGTTPVTAVGQPVGRILDKSGRGNHAYQITSTARPTYQLDGLGCPYLSFDGIDDGMQSTSVYFSGTDKVFVGAAIRKLSDASASVFVELSSTYGNAGTFAVFAPAIGGQGDISFGLNGSAGGTPPYLRATSLNAPLTVVASCRFDIGAPARDTEIIPRINGSTPSAPVWGSSTTSAGSGNFGNYPLYVGRRGGVSIPFNGRLYGLIIRGALSSADQVTKAEEYLATKSGVSL